MSVASRHAARTAERLVRGGLGPLPSRGLRLAGDRGARVRGQAARRRYTRAFGRASRRTPICWPALEVKAWRFARSLRCRLQRASSPLQPGRRCGVNWLRQFNITGIAPNGFQSRAKRAWWPPLDAIPVMSCAPQRLRAWSALTRCSAHHALNTWPVRYRLRRNRRQCSQAPAARHHE